MKGEILGLIYDGEAWKWEIPTDKLDRMLVLLGTGIRQRYLTNGEAMTLSGKLNHYSPVVQGKFERCLITHLVADGQPKDLRVKVPRQTIFAMVWWLLNLRASSLEGTFIPDPTQYFPRRALELFPDAAGGATSSKVKGWGCVCITLKEHAHGVWPRFILENTERNGQTWGRRLSVLEGFGAAQCVALWAKDIVEIGAAAIYVDNAGFVYAAAKGSSKCEYVYTMAKYIADMSAGMGVNIKLCHTGRRTTSGEKICDALSKGEFTEVRQEMPDGKDISQRTSKVLMRWINNPAVTRSLGRMGLQEVATQCDVELGRDYAMEERDLVLRG